MRAGTAGMGFAALVAVTACVLPRPVRVDMASAHDEASNAFTVSRVPLPGDGRGDYILVDAPANRLYVTHSATVHILALDSLASIAEVDGLRYAHGVAVDPTSGHGFVSDGTLNAVVMFDLATGRALRTIAAGSKPDSIIYEQAAGRVLAFNGESANVTVINPAQGDVVATITLPSDPEFSQTDGHGTVWFNMAEGNAIGVIDTRSMAVVRTIALPGCEGPVPLAFDAADRLLFSGCGNHLMMVVDADRGTVLARVPIGDSPDGIAYDPVAKTIFVANRSGGWTILRQRSRSRYVVAPTLPMDDYAKTVAVDPASHRAFSSTADLVWPSPVAGHRNLPRARPGSFRLTVVTAR